MAEILAETQQREIQPVQCMKDILDYLSARELGQVLSVIYRARAEGELLEKTPYIGFKISAIDLVDFSSYLAFVTLHFPNILVPIFEEAILKAQMIALESRPGVEGSVKNKVKLRIHSLPPVYEFCRSSIGQIRSLSDSNALLEVSGTVVRTGYFSLHFSSHVLLW
jgi:DNA replicative helicase MCM subunit Mcm2 (Cdc46/Mcm family)